MFLSTHLLQLLLWFVTQIVMSTYVAARSCEATFAFHI